MSSLLDLLVADDEVETRLLLTQILAMHGYEVRTAEDGFEALSMIRSSVPYLLLSDLNMPGMSGFELLSVVRRLHPEIRVIATSGAYSGKLVPSGIAADGFYEKASGLSPLFELLEIIAGTEHSLICSQRLAIPLWVALEPRTALESDHVLINCPQCMRAFRQDIAQANAEIRTADCCYCGGSVRYAVALAIRPMAGLQIMNVPMLAFPRRALAVSPQASL